MRRFLYLCGWTLLFVVMPWSTAAANPADTAPAGPTVTATRQGRILELDCQGPGLQSFRRNYQNPPRFTVYKNGEEVGSGTFEYG